MSAQVSELNLGTSTTNRDVGGEAVRPTKISIRHMDFYYGTQQALYDVSLDIQERVVTAFIGPSGCGKTTLLRLIAGLETPDDGEIWIGGQKVAAKGRNTVPPRGRNIGFVFQDLALWPHLTVAGNLDFVLRSQRWERRTRKDRIDEVLHMVHMAPHADKYPSQLSGGEQQRVAIARALVARSQLLLLDEPLSNLDSDLKSALLEELSVLQRRLKRGRAGRAASRPGRARTPGRCRRRRCGRWWARPGRGSAWPRAG